MIEQLIIETNKIHKHPDLPYFVLLDEILHGLNIISVIFSVSWRVEGWRVGRWLLLLNIGSTATQSLNL